MATLPPALSPRLTATQQAVLDEARSWLRTPFVHMGDQKGHGVDCGMFVLRVFHAVGLLPPFDPRPYPPGWVLHRSTDRFGPYLRDHAALVDGAPQPADIACFRMGRAPRGHLGIVARWPYIVHADPDHGVVAANIQHGDLAARFVEAWRVAGVAVAG